MKKNTQTFITAKLRTNVNFSSNLVLHRET